MKIIIYFEYFLNISKFIKYELDIIKLGRKILNDSNKFR